MRAQRTLHGHTRYGGWRSPTYSTWRCMLARCENPKHKAYARYGGAGVRVCERWHSFTNFLADMGERPSGMTLDRIDGAKGYEPGNCRWATSVEQNRNATKNAMLTFRGETRCVSEWAERLGIPTKVLFSRLNDYGWDTDRALTAPVAPRKRLTDADRQRVRTLRAAGATYAEIARQVGCSESNITNVLRAAA